jgi:carbamoyltransferase
MRDIVNEKVKLREPFRPFAPSMLEEASTRYFGKDYDAPFMLLVFPVLNEKKGRSLPLCMLTEQPGSDRQARDKSSLLRSHQGI